MFDYIEDPYVEVMRNDMHVGDGRTVFNASRGSVSKRIWEYDQNDFLRYVASVNPLGSEDKFLEKRGDRFGNALYETVRTELEGEVWLYTEGSERNLGEDPVDITLGIIDFLGTDSDPRFYTGAVKAVGENYFEK